MSSNLIDDIYSVWEDGKDAMPCDGILARLRSLDARTYAAWDAHMFGRAMTAVGCTPKTVRFSSSSVRRGVTLRMLGQVRQIHDQVVYFVERHGFVKIGTTQNLPARLAALDRGDSAIAGMIIDPVSVLAVMPGGQPVERAVHALFDHMRYDGEWFLLDGPLVSFIEAIAEARQTP